MDPSPSAQPTVIDAQDVARRRGVYIDGAEAVTITLEGLVIQGGHTQDSNGAGIYVMTGTVELRNLELRRNVARGPSARGGGLYVASGTVTLASSLIKQNAAKNGSQVNHRGATVSRNDSTRRDDSEPRGGGIALLGGTTTIRDTVFDDNWAADRGGAAYIEGASATFQSNVFRDNSAEVMGGAIDTVLAWASLTGNLFVRNTTPGSGGGMWLASSVANLRNNVFQDNSAGRHGGEGGAVYTAGGEITLVGNSFLANSASAGGGVTTWTSAVTLNDNTFRSNSAQVEGGAMHTWYGEITMSGNTFEDNSSGDGGGICAELGEITMHENTFRGNSANSGGALRFNSQSATVWGNLFRDNSAERGGGLYMEDSIVTQRANTRRGNSAVTSAGAVYVHNCTVGAVNDIIVESLSPWEGVQIQGGTLTARHWTLVDNGNYALTTDAGSTVELTNTIVASHTVAGFWGPGIRADHTLFFESGTPCGGGASCTNNLSGDPKFRNPAAGDYHINPGSAAIDSGIDAGVSNDIDYELRPFRVADVGADEYWPPGTLRQIYLPLVLGGFMP
jgi:predicted outer membrane repeat protein